MQVYTLYCVGCVTWTILYVPHFHSLDLSVLTSLMNLVGTSLFLLQAFRVNSSYGEKAEKQTSLVVLVVTFNKHIISALVEIPCVCQNDGGKGGSYGIRFRHHQAT
jgi:hypothetical protein